MAVTFIVGAVVPVTERVAPLISVTLPAALVLLAMGCVLIAVPVLLRVILMADSKATLPPKISTPVFSVMLPPVLAIVTDEVPAHC